MRALTRIAVALTAALSATTALAGPAFDGFFAGLDAACARTPAFEAWQAGLAARHVPAAAPATQVPPPADVAAGVGTVTAVDIGDHVRVTVALDGTYRGLALARIVFYFGKENGIFGWAVEFADPSSRVRLVLGPAVEKGRRTLAEPNESGLEASTGFDFEKGRVALFCDFSN